MGIRNWLTSQTFGNNFTRVATTTLVLPVTYILHNILTLSLRIFSDKKHDNRSHHGTSGFNMVNWGIFAYTLFNFNEQFGSKLY